MNDDGHRTQDSAKDVLLARVDMHVHSHHSCGASNWFLRYLKVPESICDPLTIYRTARKRGMTYVTITDHDTLAGCDEIAHLPDTFPSATTSAEFPEDGVRIGIHLYGINQTVLGDLQSIRSNIYEVRDYLLTNDVVHAVSSPLDPLTPRFTVDHFERLLVLFDHFEVLSGLRSERSSDFLRTIFRDLTEDYLHEIMNKWSIKSSCETKRACPGPSL